VARALGVTISRLLHGYCACLHLLQASAHGEEQKPAQGNLQVSGSLDAVQKEPMEEPRRPLPAVQPGYQPEAAEQLGDSEFSELAFQEALRSSREADLAEAGLAEELDTEHQTAAMLQSVLQEEKAPMTVLVPTAPPGAPPLTRSPGRTHTAAAIAEVEAEQVAATLQPGSAGRRNMYTQEDFDIATTNARSKAGASSGWKSDFSEAGLQVRDFLQDLRIGLGTTVV
jgi:hypothetical protein